jgi:predicted pyridoxine 5'-phosphate oxidase superfamily flavin-nucleotide-binding protein
VQVRIKGPEYEMMREEVQRAKPGLHCKSLLVMKVTAVYDCNYGKYAGEQVV